MVLPVHLPETLHLVESVPADTSCWSSWPSDPSGAGCAFWDHEAATGAALGEAVERYCGNLVPSGLPRASHDRLQADGVSAIDPTDLALYGDDQYEAPGFPFVRFTRSLPVRWALGRSLVSGLTTQVPASLVWVTYARGLPAAREPRTHAVMYAGIAAGRSREEATTSAILELLERDAVTITWTGGAQVDTLVPPTWLGTLAAGPTRDFDTRFLHFPSLVGAPVVGAVTRHRPTGYLAMGTACRPDPVAAALKALAEAFQLHLVVQQLDDPGSALCRLAAARESPLKPWRRDRRYAASYRGDLRDATDLGCDLQLALDPDEGTRLERELAGGRTIGLSDLPCVPGDRDGLVARLAACDIEPVSVDVTTPDVRAAGLCVVRVVAPGLVSNAPAALPLLGGRRMRAALDRNGRSPGRRPLPYG